MLEAFNNRFPELDEQEAQELYIDMTEAMLTGKSEFVALWGACQKRLRNAQFEMSELQDLINVQNV